MQKQKGTGKGQCLLKMYFGDSVSRAKNYFRIMMFLVSSVLIFLSLDRNQYFNKPSKIVT